MTDSPDERIWIIVRGVMRAANLEGRCGVMLNPSDPRVAWPDEGVPPGQIQRMA